jgi:hypothetical protein
LGFTVKVLRRLPAATSVGRFIFFCSAALPRRSRKRKISVYVPLDGVIEHEDSGAGIALVLFSEQFYQG